MTENRLRQPGDGKRRNRKRSRDSPVSEITEVVADAVERAVYLFAIDEKSYFLIENKGENAVAETGRFAFKGTQYFRTDGTNVSGVCRHHGDPDMEMAGEQEILRPPRVRAQRTVQRNRALVCPVCGQIEYPEISPAVIVAVTNGDKLLMSRYRDRPYRGYALIAGFVEIGETFEETVQREVMEEVGLKVRNIRYFKKSAMGIYRYGDDRLFAELDGDDTDSA